ncbi:hypothetical protein SEPCBS57363_003899 [Sporothrix epigloea]|uniref:4'-phosphopantetheinyl transferase domain-containing protein n=1 Tax=Sporothrix epigloea TaxID=1892477 RepID=A0ABP0DP25_9PEZI
MMPSLTTAGAAAIRVAIPFPLPQLHIGTDICHVARVYAILCKPAAPSRRTVGPPPTLKSKQSAASRFIRRVLIPREIDALGPAPKSTLAPPPPPPTMSARAAVAWLAQGHALPVPVPVPASQEDWTTPAKIPDTYAPLWRAAQFLAGRFAAKEAAIKAHPHLRGLTLQDVWIARRGEIEVGESQGEAHATAQDYLVRKGSGPPLAFVRVSNTTTGDTSVIIEQEARVSISHDGEYASAVCLGVEYT